MTWEEKIVGDSFKNIVSATIKHLTKNDALKISSEEAYGLFNLPVRKKAVSVIRRDDDSPQENGLANMAKLLKKKKRDEEKRVTKSKRDWGKVMVQLEKKADKEAKKAEKQAAAEVEKQAKKAAREAKKAEKLAAVEAEKQAKKAAREAKKAEKLAAVEAEKQAKKADKEAKKAEKLAQIAKEKAEAKAANEVRKAEEKEAKKAEREAKKAEKAKKLADEKAAKKAAIADIPCDKCCEGAVDKDGNPKMMGHRGRHTVALTCEPCSSNTESSEEEKEGEFVECPKCPEGSGKKKGHRGKCKGAKNKTSTVVEKSTELQVEDLVAALSTSNDDDESDVSLPSEVDEMGLDEDDDDDDEAEVSFTEDMKVTIEGKDYYKTTVGGEENVIVNYPDGDKIIGQLSSDGKTIIPFGDEDED